MQYTNHMTTVVQIEIYFTFGHIRSRNRTDIGQE